MKSVDELVLLVLVEGRQPLFLMLMHKQPKLMGNLAAGIGQLDQKHPPVG